MFPYREHSRSIATIQSLPVAIKSSSDNKWTSVKIHRDEDTTTPSNSRFQLPSLPSQHQPKPTYGKTNIILSSPATRHRMRKLAQLKQKLIEAFKYPKILNFIFHLSIILHYIILPYLLVFYHHNQMVLVIAHWYGIFNDCVYFVFVSVKCKLRSAYTEWVYNIILVFPLWLVHNEIVSRTGHAWVLNEIDMGYFICRCLTCPLRLYWIIKPIRGVIKIAGYNVVKYIVIFLCYAALLVHGITVWWALVMHVTAKRILPAFRNMSLVSSESGWLHEELDDYKSKLQVALKIFSEYGHPVQRHVLINITILLFSLISLFYIMYMKSMLFIIDDTYNKRLIKLQHFTRSLIFHFHKSKEKKLIKKLVENHKNVEEFKKSVALSECNTMLNNINWSLVQDVLFDINLPALKTGSLFGLKHENADSYIRHLSSKMKRNCYNANETIFQQRNTSDRMVVIVEGFIELLAEDNETSMLCLGPGSCLGQIGLMLTLRAKATVRCLTHVRILTLAKKDFLLTTLSAFPELYHLVAKNTASYLNESKKRKRTMMMRPPQFGLTTAERANRHLYKVTVSCNVQKRKGSLDFYKNSFIGKVDHNLILNAIWNYFMVVISVIIAIFYPYYIAFERRFPKSFSIVSIVMEASLVADLILTLICFDEGPDADKTVPRRWCDTNKLRQHLWRKLKHWSFYLDFFGALYLEHFTFALDKKSFDEEQLNFLYHLFKLNRVVKVYKLFHLLTILHFRNEYYKRLFIYLITMFLLIYYGAVVLFLTACFHLTCKSSSWFRRQQVHEYKTQTQVPRSDDKFLSSLHVSLVNFHRLEMLWMEGSIDIGISMILTLIGCTLLTWCFIDLAHLQYLLLKPKVYYLRDLDDIKIITRDHAFPGRLRKRLLNYYHLQYPHDPYYYFYQYLLKQHNNNYLTKQLLAEILVVERAGALLCVTLLKNLGAKFVERLTLNSKIYLLPAKDVITYRGNVNKEMFIILQGQCKYKGVDNHYQRIGPIRESSPNSHFGMASLFFNLPESFTVKTITPCILISIDGSALQEALLHYPLVNAALQRVFHSEDYQEAIFEEISMAGDQYSNESDDSIGREKSMNQFQKFLSQGSFVNVVSYCAKRNEVYGAHFRNEEITPFKYFMLPFTINPRGLFYYIWVALRLAVALMYGFTCPMMFVTPEFERNFFILNVVCDSVLGLDIIILVYLCFTNSHGVLIVHPLQTLRFYGQNGFIVDALLAMPNEWIYRAAGNKNYFVFCLIRCVKVLQVYKFFVVLAKMKDLIDIKNTGLVCELIKCIIWTLLLQNVFACMFIATECVAVNEPELKSKLYISCKNQCWLYRSVYKDHITEFKGYLPLLEVYTISLYWTTCILFGLSFGDIYAQGGKNFQVVIALIIMALFIRGYYVKSLTSYWLATVSCSKDNRTVEYQRKIVQLKRFLKRYKVSSSLEKKFRDNATYYWRRTCGIDNTLLFSHLHTTLLQDTLSFLYEKTLQQVPLFQTMDRSFLRIVALIARPMYFLPNQIIMNIEDVCDEFYIIHEGIIHVELARTSFQANLGKGSLLGYYSKESTPIMSILATTVNYVDVLCIKSIDFFNILKNYSKFDEKLKNVMNEYKDFMPNRIVDDNIVNIIPTKTTESLLFKEKITRISRNVHFYNGLDNFFSLAAFVNALLVPISLLFYHPIVVYCNLFLDLLFLCVFALEFVKPYHSTRGVLITNYSLIRKRVRRRKFLFIWEFGFMVAIFCSYLLFYNQLGEVFERRFSTFVQMRLLALYRMKYLFRRSFHEITDNLYLYKIFNFIMVVFIEIHWLGCAWALLEIYLKRVELRQDNITVSFTMYVEGLLLIANIISGSTTITAHFTSYTEKVVVILIVLGVKVVNCYFGVQFIICIWIRVKSVVKFNFQLKQLQKYLKTININPYQIRNLSRHLVRLEKEEFGASFPIVLTLLPAPLVNELKIHLYLEIIEKSYVFHGTQMSFQRNIATQLKRSVFYKGEVIVHHGEINKCMYFISKGSVEIVTINDNHTETRHDVLHDYEMFGLAQGLFKYNVPHQFTFKALTDVEMLCLQLEQWEHLLRYFPKSKEVIYNRIRNVQL